jgi:hypothetical protein
MDQDEIRSVIARLARPHASGGVIIERAAILAEGREFAAIRDWIISHGGTPESPSGASHGLHGSRLNAAGGTPSQSEPRYLLPASALV